MLRTLYRSLCFLCLIVVHCILRSPVYLWRKVGFPESCETYSFLLLLCPMAIVDKLSKEIRNSGRAFLLFVYFGRSHRAPCDLIGSREFRALSTFFGLNKLSASPAFLAQLPCEFLRRTLSHVFLQLSRLVSHIFAGALRDHFFSASILPLTWKARSHAFSYGEVFMSILANSRSEGPRFMSIPES